MDVIQPLNEIIDVPKSDKLAKDIKVASKSTLVVKDGYVVGVKDILFLANTKSMNNLVTRTYTNSEMERKVVVRTTVKFARAAAPKKGRTVVRTTVKCTTWEVEEADSRCAFCYEGDDVAGLIYAAVEHYRAKLADGGCVKLEIEVEFEPVKYEKFIEVDSKFNIKAISMGETNLKIINEHNEQ